MSRSRLCVFKNVIVSGLPAHTSHVLQPLEVTIFGPLKKSLKNFISIARSQQGRNGGMIFVQFVNSCANHITNFCMLRMPQEDLSGLVYGLTTIMAVSCQ